MLKKTITYTDFNGNERTEDFYFNLLKTEALKIANDLPDGITDAIDKDLEDNAEESAKRLVEKLGNKGIMEFIEDLIRRSYGKKSEDGRSFIKDPKLTEAFMQSPAYDEFYMEMMTNDVAAANFVTGILPRDLADDASRIMAKSAKAIAGGENSSEN